MFETLKSLFRVKEMRRKLFYVIGMIFIIRIGSQLPVPGVDSDVFKQWFQSNTGDAFNFFDAFTGGSFESMFGICSEYYTIYYIIHYHSASHNRNSRSGRNAQRRRRGKKEADCNHPLCYHWTCFCLSPLQ